MELQLATQQSSALSEGKGARGSQQLEQLCGTERKCTILRLFLQEVEREVELAPSLPAFISLKYLKEKGRVAYGTQHVLVRLGEGLQP